MKRLFCCFFIMIGMSLAAEECWDQGCFGCDWGFDAGVEFLYLKPCVEQKECAFISDFFDPYDACADSCGRYKTWDFNWEPALRFFLCKEDLFSCFNLSASYTYFNFSASKSCALPEDDGALTCPIFACESLHFDNFSDLQTRNRIRYQDFDLLLSKPCCMSCCHTVVPFVGLQSVCFDQKVKACGNGFIEDDYGGYSIERRHANVSQSSHFSGVGLKMGLSYLYDCCQCLQLYTKFSGSIVYGHNKERFTQCLKTTYTCFESSSDPYECQEDDYALLKTKSSDCLCVPGFSLGVGVLYTSCLCSCFNFCNACCDSCNYSLPFTIFLGYEFVDWFNLWQFRKNEVSTIKAMSRPSRGQIGFHGATFGLALSF